MRRVEVTISIQTSSEKIIAAFTEPEMLKDWWAVERMLIEKKPGGLYTLAWNISEKGFGFVSSGIIKEYQVDSLLVIENFIYLNPEKTFLGPMTLTVSAKQKGNSAELTLCQDGYQIGADWDWYYEAVKLAWPSVAQNLKKYLEKIKK